MDTPALHTAASLIPRPKSRRPWWRRDKAPAIYDQDGKVVSFIAEAEFLFHVEQCHDGLQAALYRLTADFHLAATLAGYSADAIDAALADAKAQLARAGFEVRT